MTRSKSLEAVKRRIQGKIKDGLAQAAAGQWIDNPCPCGAGGGQYLEHYGILKCSCDRLYWALRPDRHGPLVAFPYPVQSRIFSRENFT
jgi:hypothetical protein